MGFRERVLLGPERIMTMKAFKSFAMIGFGSAVVGAAAALLIGAGPARPTSIGCACGGCEADCVCCSGGPCTCDDCACACGCTGGTCCVTESAE